MCEGAVLLTEAWVVVVCCEVLVLGELACLLAAIVACKRDWQRNECLKKLFDPAQLFGSVRTPSPLPQRVYPPALPPTGTQASLAQLIILHTLQLSPQC